MGKKSLVGIIAGLIVLVIVAYVVMAKPFSKPETASPPVTKPGVTLADLYKDALKHMKDKNWALAKQELEHLQLSKPGYKDVKQLLLKAAKEDLYARANQALEQKDWDAAIAYLETLGKIDPNFKDTPSLLDEANTGNATGTKPNPAANTNVSVGQPPTGGPMDAIPGKVSGYSYLSKSWLNEPIEAEAAYRSASSAAAAKIDIVSFGAGKYETEAMATAQVAKAKSDFGTNGVNTTVNGHKGAYFGRYSALEYPRPARLVWQNKNWVFWVGILPKDKNLAESTMLQTALDFAKAVKY